MASSAPEMWGIDLGAMKTMVVTSQGEIVRNELGGIGTATLASFQGRERHLGEAAVSQATANTRNTILHVHRLVGRTYDEVVGKDGHLTQYYMFDLAKAADGGAAVKVDYNGESVTFPPYVLLGMLLGKLRSYTLEGRGVEESLSLSIAVPRGFPQAHVQQVVDAARLAGVEDVGVVSSADALLATYRNKHPATDFAPGEVHHVLLVEVGHSQSSVLLAAVTAAGSTLLSEASDVAFGAANFDDRLFRHFQAEIQQKYKGEVKPGDKKALRLLAAVEKIRKHLSTIPEAHAQVENVVEGRDIDLSLKRDQFAELVASEVDRFVSLLTTCLAALPQDATLYGVEVSGGAMRMPLLQEALVKVTNFTKPLGMKLDDAAIAFGAALLRARPDAKANGSGDAVRAAEATNGHSTDPAAVSSDDNGNGIAEKPEDAAAPSVYVGEGQLTKAELAALRAEEVKREEADKEIRAMAEVRNSIEAFILQLRGARGHAKHGKLVNSAVVDPFVDALENYLYSEEADNATLAEFNAKLSSAREEAAGLLKDFNEAVEKDRLAYEQSLEEEAKKAEAEREAAGDDDDHDNRKLKKPERMRMVMKNKEEGNELFGGGNYRPAAARYVKALTHCAKFFDLNPTDEEEVNNIKLSLYSNLAQCYLKLENWDAAIKNCEEALKIQKDFVKALYRRAVAYDAKKLHDEAEADLTRAAELAPSDKLVANLLVRTKAAIKKQKDKEKKMWGKAFA